LRIGKAMRLQTANADLYPVHEDPSYFQVQLTEVPDEPGNFFKSSHLVSIIAGAVSGGSSSSSVSVSPRQRSSGQPT
jgi:hypothetical protein